jgi:hypothetical protein
MAAASLLKAYFSGPFQTRLMLLENSHTNLLAHGRSTTGA